MSARHFSRSDPIVPSIRESPSRGPGICRCGTRLATGDPTFSIEGLSDSSRAIFDGRRFCSIRCVRAFCLESLEALDALDTNQSKTIITDIHEVYQGLADTFARILLGT